MRRSQTKDDDAITSVLTRNSSSTHSHQIDFVFKVIIIGSQAAGKSSILTSYIDDGEFSDSYLATIGVDFRLKTLQSKSRKMVKLQLWDTAGQERFASLTSQHYKGAHACICVYDITSEKSFTAAEMYLQTSIQTHGISAGETLLVGNKIDLEGERQVSLERGRALSDKFSCSFTEISAKQTGSSQLLFQELIEKLVETYAHINETQLKQKTQVNSKKLTPIVHNETSGQTKKKCCS